MTFPTLAERQRMRFQTYGTPLTKTKCLELLDALDALLGDGTTPGLVEELTRVIEDCYCACDCILGEEGQFIRAPDCHRHKVLDRLHAARGTA